MPNMLFINKLKTIVNPITASHNIIKDSSFVIVISISKDVPYTLPLVAA